MTGAESDGAYLIMEAIVQPGGPPPHIHHHLGSEHIRLERIQVLDAPGVTHLRFRLAK